MSSPAHLTVGVVLGPPVRGWDVAVYAGAIYQPTSWPGSILGLPPQSPLLIVNAQQWRNLSGMLNSSPLTDKLSGNIP